ncbi:MAG: hypothetical protein K0R12_1208 [Gammaproteobacteria bacterium]|jgi:hypothetical protein|nr:hypothetical protein [Gammaproteobacteria bacterium]
MPKTRSQAIEEAKTAEESKKRKSEVSTDSTKASKKAKINKKEKKELEEEDGAEQSSADPSDLSTILSEVEEITTSPSQTKQPSISNEYFSEDEYKEWHKIEQDCQINQNPDLLSLNILAWLLNTNTKSCTAVSLIKNKLIISENNIYNNTQSNNPKFSHIENVLVRLNNIIHQFITQDEVNKYLLGDLFGLIFEKKFQGEEKGYLRATEEFKREIKELITKTLSSLDSSSYKEVSDNIEKAIDSATQLAKSRHHSSAKSMAVVGIAKTVLVSLIKAIPMIAEQDKLRLALNDLAQNSSIIKNPKSKPTIRIIRYEKANNNLQRGPSDNNRIWLNSDEFGCAILATNKNGTHAELKPIDCLLSSIITEKHFEETIPIGISRKCCKDCYITIIALNLVLEAHNIRVSGSHYRSFDNWPTSKPFFLQKPSTRSKKEESVKTSSSVKIKRNSALIEEILLKIKDIRQKIESRSLVLPDEEYYMSHSDHSQEIHSTPGIISSNLQRTVNQDDDGHSPSTTADSPDKSSSPFLHSSSSAFFHPVPAQGVGFPRLTIPNSQPKDRYQAIETNLIEFTSFLREGEFLPTRELQEKLARISSALANCTEAVQEILDQNKSPSTDSSSNLGNI